MKSICIKTNNSILLEYLLTEFNLLELSDVYFSTNEFRHYKNIIIHYKGEKEKVFLERISGILACLVIDELEEEFLNRILLQNYFYFSQEEKRKITNIYYDLCSEDFLKIFDQKYNYLNQQFFSFLEENHTLVLNGFINFRVKAYFIMLENLIDEAVNNYIIEKEYLEFISLLKLYINSQNAQCELVHLVYSKEECILLDNEKNIINLSDDLFKAKYLSDISFSSNDFALNSLLTLLPKTIHVHLVDHYADEFIHTLKLIFENKLKICTDCNICKLYQQKTYKETLLKK